MFGAHLTRELTLWDESNTSSFGINMLKNKMSKKPIP